MIQLQIELEIILFIMSVHCNIVYIVNDEKVEWKKWLQWSFEKFKWLRF